jgi:CheY-like chemotaxis protein
MRSILIVDDCPEIASILARHVRGAGHEVSIAHDGADALARVGRKVPDCILLDLMMPVMSGVEVLHRLKEDPATARIPIVLVSARVGEGRSHIFAERDADYCVGKPFTRRQILDAVGAALA